MGNYKTTKKEVKNYLLARTPLIIIDAAERERVERLLREAANELPADIYYYTDTKQVNSLKSGQTLEVEQGQDPLQCITGIFKKSRHAIFAFGDIKRIGDDNVYSREVLNILYLAKEMNSTLILVTADPVWSRLAQFGMLTSLDYPDMEERIDQINDFIAAYSHRFLIEWQEPDVRKAATLLSGFTEIQIENILSTTLIANRGLTQRDLHGLSGQKKRLYAAVSTVQPVRVSENLQVSGLEGLKTWLLDKKAVFFASDEALKFRDLDTPKGILLAGVPGCGKSFSAKMIAREWELPLFRFDIGSVYDKWVGESEKKMGEALQFIDQVSPCILWIDEIEKALSVSDSGNDTGKRVLGQFLFWLQESTSRVFLVATANDIALLPIELFRKGRFSEVFFIDLPNEAERQAALCQYGERALHVHFSEEELAELVQHSQGFSYSDIEYAIKDVAQLALLHGQQIIGQELILDKFKAIVPISQSNPEMIEKIREWGRTKAVAASNHAGGMRNEYWRTSK